jgi:hypothetical protein
MSLSPSLTVIMPAYNSAHFVTAAVQSVLAQTHSDFEYLIVDDGSVDGTTKLLRDLASGDPRIHLIEQENRGIVASVNRMIEIARAPFIARMDADDISLPERFARQLEYLGANPHIGAVGAQYVEIDAAGGITDPGIRHPVGPSAVRAQMLVEQPFSNPTVMFRADALRRVGGYREAFGYCEDYDLFLRLSRVTDLDNLPDVLLHYRRSPGQMSIANNSQQTQQAVKALFAHKEVLAGRTDPFAGLSQLPTLDQMDAHVGRTGVARQLRSEIATRLRFSPMVLAGDEFALLLTQARSGDGFTGGWRTVGRSLRLGLVWRSVQLATALTRGHARRLLQLALRRQQPRNEKPVETGRTILH